MNIPTDPRLQHYPVNLHSLPHNGYQSAISPDLDPYNPDNFALNSLANASVNSSHSFSPPTNNAFAQPRAAASQLPVQTRNLLGSRNNGAASPGTNGVSKASSQSNSSQTYPTPPQMTWDGSNVNSSQINPSPQNMYMPALSMEAQDRLTHTNPRLNSSPNPPAATTALSTPTKPNNDDHTLPGSTYTPGPTTHFTNMKLHPSPPNLAHWRTRLFNITTPITLSEDEFTTYFPHVDNVYSHRSTQRYKRKPFVSHYWDCRLKGRPPGTAKSDDPTKKKRKRNTRERDLCDVKIKITEYFAAGEEERAEEGSAHGLGGGKGADGSSLTFIMGNDGSPSSAQQQQFGMLAPMSSLPPGHPGANGARWYSIQRVNGNGTGDKDDDVDLDHKHTLEESDKIKKNSVQRWLMKEEKEQKRAQVCVPAPQLGFSSILLFQSPSSDTGTKLTDPSLPPHNSKSRHKAEKQPPPLPPSQQAQQQPPRLPTPRPSRSAPPARPTKPPNAISYPHQRT